MTTVDIIIQIFCLVDDEMKAMPKHSLATLYPSELVTIGILFALKGGYFRAFYRWLKPDYATCLEVCQNAAGCNACSRPIRTGVIGFWLRLVSSPSTIVIPSNCFFPSVRGAAHSKLGRKARIKDAGVWASNSVGCSMSRDRWWSGIDAIPNIV